jgi:predicted DNA-binding transcriptional regulator YafY
MPRPTTRVLAMLELLQTHGRMSGSELARRLQVDPRTVRRYVGALEELGIPVTAERGRDGAYMLVAGYKLPPMMFTDDEALALSIGLLAARGLGLAEGAAAVGSAQAKLERVMPSNLKRRVRSIDETVTLDLSRSSDADTATLMLGALAAAAKSQTRVRMRYRAARGDEAERDFDPYGLVYRGGHWYAVGHCHLRRGLRSFRLDRVESVRALEKGFSKPPGFDALAHLTFSIATLPRAFAVEVLLETDLATARRQLFPAAGVLEGTAEGVVLRSQVDELAWFARELARLSFPFIIRRPAALRDALEAHAESLLRRSDRTRSPKPKRS